MADRTAQETARANMVDSQVRPNLVHDTRVIEAMRALPREAFAPAGAFAYADADIDLGAGPVPALAAGHRQAGAAGAGDQSAHVLVVGAGSGYTAALLAACGAQVVALEEETRLDTGALAALPRRSTRSLENSPRAGRLRGPYDAILIEGAVPAIPETFAAQLTPGGRLVTIMADHDEPAGLGRGVVAEATGNGFAVVKCSTARRGFCPASAMRRNSPCESCRSVLARAAAVRRCGRRRFGAARMPPRPRRRPSLTQALAEAYDNNATLQEQRASLRATDETVPTAFPAGGRPSRFTETAGQVTGNETELETGVNPDRYPGHQQGHNVREPHGIARAGRR